MTEADIGPVRGVADAAFGALNEAMHEPPHPEPSPEMAQRRRWRLAHVLQHDPEGSLVAEADGRVVGSALALRRGDLWHLSLLVVDPAQQGAGVGRRLLDAALVTAQGAARAMILSSRDPRAIRRYVLAGFDLVPSMNASGTIDRSALPAPDGVREGDDLDFADAVAREVRGASYRLEVEGFTVAGPLIVTEEHDGRGFAWTTPTGPLVLAATSPSAARRLLWEALARTTDEDTVAVEWITADAGWAADIVVRAGLAVKPKGPMLLRGWRPGGPWLPNGAWG